VKEMLNNNDLSFVYSDFYVIGDDSKIKYIYKIPKYNWKKLLFAGYCYIPQPSMFIRKRVFEEIGYFDTEYKLASDYDYILRFADRIRGIKINKPLVGFRFGSHRLSERLRNVSIAESNTIVSKYNLNRNLFLKYLYRILLKSELILNNFPNYLSRIFQ